MVLTSTQVIDHFLSINPFTFWLAGYPRDNETGDGTRAPIDRAWSSPFVGWRAQQCWDWRLQCGEKDLDWQAFVKIGKTLKSRGLVLLCYNVTEEEAEDERELREEDEIMEPYDAGVHCFSCEARYAWMATTTATCGDGWRPKLRGYGGFDDDEDTEWFANAEAAGAVPFPEQFR